MRQPTDVGTYGPTELALGWERALVGPARDRPLARAVVGTFGLILGASSGMFLGGMVGVAIAMAVLPMAPQLAFFIVLFTTLSCASAGAVIGPRVLQREAFDDC
ncbi:hypothetical protein G6O69_21945 [Pseudenhygromyxa sp. WMMC2535]|uniref:hypothetical protein n=1 Tax=Pseudenhygromyxa sp. WMMC2535 TaxID=2712867 RepID=UPI00155591A0|nr:hypothetical protein [Pseudenhygromyxa sp. WMMC2535]NVB40519.1 hypothetical protein [Pseudenhygromyxa sp. WMMC2535]